MIGAELVLDGAGLLQSCRIQGHAGAAPRGEDLVCSAVSVLGRTLVKVLGEREDITIRGSIPDRGNFFIEVEYTEGGREFLSAAGTFFMEGLLSVSSEFPQYCTVNIDRRS